MKSLSVYFLTAVTISESFYLSKIKTVSLGYVSNFQLYIFVTRSAQENAYLVQGSCCRSPMEDFMRENINSGA